MGSRGSSQGRRHTFPTWTWGRCGGSILQQTERVKSRWLASGYGSASGEARLVLPLPAEGSCLCFAEGAAQPRELDGFLKRTKHSNPRHPSGPGAPAQHAFMGPSLPRPQPDHRAPESPGHSWPSGQTLCTFVKCTCSFSQQNTC